MKHIVTNTKTPSRSFSLFDGWGTCQLRTFFDRTGPRTPPTPAMLRGTQAHTAMEDISKRLLAGDNYVEAVNYVREHMPQGPLCQTLLDSWIINAAQMFKGLEVSNVERWFDKDSNRWDLRGRIDLEAKNTPCLNHLGYPTGEVREGPCVLDFKTIAQARYCRQDWEVAKSLQAAIYCIVTGIRRFGFVYLLPNGEVRLTMSDIEQETIDRHSGWLTWAARSLDAAWAHMRELLERGEDPSLAFSPAPAGHPFCSINCQHAQKCIFGGEP